MRHTAAGMATMRSIGVPENDFVTNEEGVGWFASGHL